MIFHQVRLQYCCQYLFLQVRYLSSWTWVLLILRISSSSKNHSIECQDMYSPHHVWLNWLEQTPQLGSVQTNEISVAHIPNEKEGLVCHSMIWQGRALEGLTSSTSKKTETQKTIGWKCLKVFFRLKLRSTCQFVKANNDEVWRERERD